MNPFALNRKHMSYSSTQSEEEKRRINTREYMHTPNKKNGKKN